MTSSWSLMMCLKLKEHQVWCGDGPGLCCELIHFSYLYIFLDLCKGKTTSNEFYIINLNLLQVFMFRINTFSTLGDNTCSSLRWLFYLRTLLHASFSACVREHFKIELKYVNLKLVVYRISPGSVNKQFFLKTVFVVCFIYWLIDIYYIPVFYSYLKWDMSVFSECYFLYPWTWW